MTLCSSRRSRGVLRGVRLQRLAPALPDWPADGAVQLRGRPDAPQLSVQLNDRQQRELRAELALAGVGAARKLLLNTLQLRDGPARLDGAGELALAGERAFRLQATLRQLNPARWSPQLDAGQLNAAVSVQGAAQPLRVQGELTLADSQYRGQPASARLVAASVAILAASVAMSSGLRQRTTSWGSRPTRRRSIQMWTANKPARSP